MDITSPARENDTGFLEDILARLQTSRSAVLLRELRESGAVEVTGAELISLISQARGFLSARGLKIGDRCGLLAHNSVRWIALDLAMMAEGLIVVPLYARQAAAELVGVMKDCSPSMICFGDEILRETFMKVWPEAPPQVMVEDIFSTPAFGMPAAGRFATGALKASQVVTIIYTSGTSGQPKGVMLNAGNISYILGCTSERLGVLMEKRPGQDKVFHFLPFSFGASRIALLTYLLRGSLVTLNTDLSRLATDLPAAEADYFLNVPAILERMRKAVDEQIAKKGGIGLAIYTKAKAAWARQQQGRASLEDTIWLAIGNALVFTRVRKRMVGSRVRALISGSAPLLTETQQFFGMLRIPVLQVYGLTETTGICTMDDPRSVELGTVGPGIPGLEMKLGEEQEILARGPNIFPGYWNRPEETSFALREGWFHTGDQGELTSKGNWRIVGRLKNMVILSSGHKVPPEPIEEELLRSMPGAQQAVLIGNGKGYLTALISGDITRQQVQSGIDALNAALPHYKQIRAFHLLSEPFSIENGLLTANGKLKRDQIASRLTAEIEAMYGVKQAS